MKKKIYYLFVFIIFLLLFFLSPISGDDWGNYLVGKTGLYHSIGNAIGMYFSWEGRFISRILINILTCNKILWNIINALFVTSIIYFIDKLVNKKNSNLILLLITFVIFFMNIFTFSQVVVWIAGNITYLFVIPLLLSYIYYLFNKNDNKIFIILFGFINFIIPMFVEHTAIALVFINIIYLIYYYIKNKKVDKRILIYLVLSLISTMLMLLSPGSFKRNGIENIEFNNLSFFGKIIYNIPNFIYYTFISNSYLLILLSLSNYYLIKNNIKNNILKVVILVFMLLIPLLTVFLYPINQFNSIMSYIIDQYNIFIIVYYIIYSLLIVYLNVINYIENKNEKLMLFLIIGFVCNGEMLLSPTWGFRTGFATYIFLSIYSLYVISDYIKDNKIINYILSIILTFTIICYIVFYISIHLQYKENLNIIKKAVKDKSKTIEIIKYPIFANCNINPDNEYHLKKYKEYYGIDKDVNITFLDNNWKYIIIYNK